MNSMQIYKFYAFVIEQWFDEFDVVNIYPYPYVCEWVLYMYDIIVGAHSI